MVFIGVALLVAVGLALAIAADAGSLVGLTQEQTAQIIPLLAILIMVAGGVFGRRMRLAEMATNIMLWVGIFGVAIIGYAYRDEVGNIASRVVGELSPGTATVSEDGSSATFRRVIGGSFRLNATINGTKIPMIFDTGATAVVLKLEDAIASGIATDALKFTINVQTANGVGHASIISLDQITIGQIVRKDIRAFVAEKGALETSLLGMTFLETLSSYSVTADAVEFHD